MAETTNGAGFWTAVAEATSPTAYRPRRNGRIVAARLESRAEPYYVLKEPLTKSYLRLSEADYALWWQMDGRKSIKDLLFYSLSRYHTLPFGHLNSLITDLRAGHFLQDHPTGVYDQVERELAARAPASRGRRLSNGFLHTEVSIDGLDDFFTPLYDRLKPLFSLPAQLLFLIIILVGGTLYVHLFRQQIYALSGSGGYSVISLFLANLVVIAIHELAHGLTTKHFGRELNRGGFLIYWGMPAFFVDTRDTWLSPRQARIAVSWAGPHSGLIIGGIVGGALTAVAAFYPAYANTLWAGFFFQMGFIAFFSVFLNLNPLLELDGYFILMDWLEMPGLRQRAFRFWRERLWPKLKVNRRPRAFWDSLRTAERVFTFYGGLALIYSAYALVFALYFWRTRLLPLAESLWRDYGLLGQMVVLLVTAVLVIPAVYYLFQYSWSRVQAGLEWLARRDLLARADVLALVVGLPLLAGIPLLLTSLSTLPRPELWLNLVVWLLHIAAVAALIGVARQLPGSRFQWAMWSLVVAPLGATLAWMGDAFQAAPLWRELSLILAAAAILAAGMVAGFTVWPKFPELKDRLLMGFFFLLGLLYVVGTFVVSDGRWTATALILLGVFPGLVFMTPLLINFWRSRFAIPWLLLVLAILALPWLQFYPLLHLPVAALWLYAGLMYLLLGALAQFTRHTVTQEQAAAFDERERLVNSFNHFMRAMFASYEAVFGGRRLAAIQAQMIALGPIDPDAAILPIAHRCRDAVLLAVDRLDDLAGAPFTRKAGQAAYDSLPWLEAETLARHVLANTGWGSQLAQGFIQARDRRAELIRQADIFAGFDQEAVRETLAIAHTWQARAGTMVAQAGQDAAHFYLIESGEVGVFLNGVQMATLTAGGYFGTLALLDSGQYLSTYRTLTAVTGLIIDRGHFDPLLRADTTLARQVSSGAKVRHLLKQMPLFSSLSPQQLAAIDARLVHRNVAAGEIFVRQGQPRSHLFIIAAGLVEVLYQDSAGERVIGKLGPGEHFGEHALFADVPYHATCRAVTHTHLLLLDEPKFDELVAECDRMSHYVEQIGSGRLIATRRRLGPGAIIS